MEKVHTTCIYCGCGCGLFLHAEEGLVVGASPSPMHPMSRGRLCIEGWLAGEFVGHPDRLHYPLVRESERFSRASWEKALSRVVEEFSRIRKRARAGRVGRSDLCQGHQ